MARKATSPASPAPPLALEGDLDIFSIHQQWEQVQPVLNATGDTASLDLSAIGDLDLSGLQLLCALHRDLQAKGVRLVLLGIQKDWRPRFGPLGAGGLFDEVAP
jgi:anti-anti-sigma regulatory factor